MPGAASAFLPDHTGQHFLADQRFALLPTPEQHFPRQHRLLDEHAFKPLFATPRWRVGGAVFLLLVSPSPTTQARLGLVVPKKRIRHSVQRNLVKRIARESFRCRQLPPVDVIILVRSPLKRPDRRQLRSELEQLWDKLLAKIDRD